ncbi:MAG: hypothetical protein ACYDCL_21510 [Myxococcales bacterium]
MASVPCSVRGCGNYRAGHFLEHIRTKAHQRALNGPVVRQPKDLFRFHLYNRLLSSRGPEAEDQGMVRVKGHRRSPPDDGSAKTVKVRRYWRFGG